LKHHTSKLSTYDDIGTLETFGFRGEALASLCALSAMSVTTCLAEDAPKGSKLTFEPSGKLKDVAVVAAQRGTTVSVENLFHNLPVRRRELERNIKREWNKVIALLNQYACIQTNLKFSVSQQPTKGRKILLFSTKGNLTTRDNIINIFGAKASQGLVPLELSLEVQPSTQRVPLQAGLDSTALSTEVKVIGHVSRPSHGDGRQTPDRQMFFVNSRPCGLPQFAKVFNEVYRSYNSSQSPFILADIQLDTHLYDVNVSPDKRTILLHEQNHLLETLRSSLTELFDAQDQTVPVSQLLRTPKPATQVGAGGVSSGVSSAASQARPDPSTTLIYTTSATRSKILGSSTKSSNPPQTPSVPAKGSIFSKPALALRQDRDASQPAKTSPFDWWLAGSNSKITQPSSSDEEVAGDQEAPESSSSESEMELEQSQDVGEGSDEEHGVSRPKRSASKRPLDPSQDAEGEPDVSSEDGEPPAKRHYTRSNNTITVSVTSPVLDSVPHSITVRSTDKDDDESSSEIEDSDAEEEPVEILVQGERESDEAKDSAASEAREVNETAPKATPKDSQPEEQADDEVVYTPEAEFEKPIPSPKPKPRQAATPALLQPTYRRKGAAMSLVQNIELVDSELQWHMKCWADRSAKRVEKPLESQHVEDITAPDAEAKLPLIITKADFAKMRVAGQFNLGFIIAVRPKDPDHSSSQHDELFIIDQHASDEKYNFERLQDTTVLQSQRLVVPKQLELTALEEEIVMQSTNAIEANGFKIDVDLDGEYPVGQRCQLTSLPLSRDTTFNLADLEELISLLSDESAETRVIPRPSKVRKMFAMRACRSSVMIGKPLTLRQMYSLTNHMGELDKPWNCPHGRPTMRHLCRLDTWDGAGWNEDTGPMSKASWLAYARGE
jgi:DNA mismatch repair protein PMS2